jgi:hypothetical protein
MNPTVILGIIGAITNLTKGISSLVDNSAEVFKDNDADNVRTAAAALNEANATLEQVVLTKLG